MKTSEWHMDSEEDNSTWTWRYENNKIYDVKEWGESFKFVSSYYIIFLLISSIYYNHSDILLYFFKRIARGNFTVMRILYQKSNQTSSCLSSAFNSRRQY